MEGPWNYQPCRNGHPFPLRKADTCLDFLCKYCGKTLNVFTYHRCYAVNAYCYKCRHHGHFARMCSFHVKSCENPNPKKKSKSKSKIQRDSDRMRTFIEKKQMSQFPFQGLEDKELSAFTCSIQDESAKQHINKLEESNRNFIKEIAVLKCENSKLDTVIQENVMLRNSLDNLNLERLKHVQLIQTIELELAEHASGTQNFEIEIMRLKEDNRNLTNTRQRLTMELKNTDMHYNRILNDMEGEIQRLREENVNSRHEIQHLDIKHSNRGVRSTLAICSRGNLQQHHRRGGGYPRR
ncbi:PPL [Mytilus edulis]|uniref:PPL n=1 Tax=Mytilus edulis TaxID=6550 RepID=A0A8S3R8C3_MYTED|nr:PPL [Mytilus edulis]